MPVDPVHPLTRRLTMLREAGIEHIVLRHRDHVDEFASLEYTVIDMSPLASEQAPASTEFTGLSRPSDAAYIAFTSGTTGKPKGIVLSHAGLITNIKTLREPFAVTSSSRVAQFHP